MTKQESEARQAANCGLSVAEYRRRRAELLQQCEELKEGAGA